MAKGKQAKVRTRKKIFFVVLVGVGVVLVLGALIGLMIWWAIDGSKSELAKRGLADRGLPVMEITLADGLELSEIDGGSKDVKYEGNEVDLYDLGAVYEYDGVEVKGRGNTTWIQEKKPYQIEFEKNVDLLGLGKAKKWVLLTNYFDASYLRNDIALMLADMVGMSYSHRGDFVELYVNDEYRGLYYLVQKIEIAKGSVDLRNEDGILFEIDTLHGGEGKCYETYLGECLILKDTRRNMVENDGMVGEFLVEFNEAEKMAENKNYERAEEILDVESFAEYFLINEFTVNPDAYCSSFYLYKNDEGKIAAGPVWDFDFALANHLWVWWTSEDFFSPRENMFGKQNAFGYGDLDEDRHISKLVYYLMEMPEFQEEVKNVFRERMSGRENEFIQAINNKAEEIYQAAKMDGDRWGRESFEEEMIMIVKWIRARYEHFEETYGRDGHDLLEVI